MLVIEIRDGTAREESAVGKRGAFTVRRQEGWVQINGETRRIRLSLGRELPAYQPGKYQMTDESFMVNQYGDLTVGRLVLRPLAAQKAA